jgi:LAS superfamily LD-carboxypeptidase LdcB
MANVINRFHIVLFNLFLMLKYPTVMKKPLLIFFMVLIAHAINAQKIYFIYLQTETGDPFFVRLNEKLYNSTPSGYLILSKLRDSTYNFQIGFPGKNDDLHFTATVNRNDQGYLIKNFGEKGWGLYNMQTLSIQMAGGNINASIKKPVDTTSVTQVNSFTDLLSKATDDPTLRTNVSIKKEEKKPDTIQIVKKEIPVDQNVKENVVQADKNLQKPKEENKKIIEQKIDKEDKTIVSVNKKTEYKKSQVTKISGTSVSEGLEIVFVDQYTSGNKDTIKILIPEEKKIVNVDVVKDVAKKDDKRFLEILPDSNQKKENPKIDSSVKKVPQKEKIPVIENKNNCKSFATDNDFLKLRRKMAAKTNDDGMIDEAKKYFREKCFSSEQIRNLSSMFLSNAGKYHFFDAAYGFVSDPENFASLQSELKEEYYINRFKAMLHN